MSKKVVIEIRGGLLDITELPDGITVEVIDFDIDGYDEEDITVLKSGEKAHVSVFAVNKNHRKEVR